MGNKAAEREYAAMCARLNIWAHKWQDVRYCPNCNKPIFMTKRTDDAIGDTNETIVDYLCFAEDVPFWTEVKGKPGQTTLPFGDISLKQRQFLYDWISRRGIYTFLFITLGHRAPSTRFAWLIPFVIYMQEERSQVRKSWTTATMLQCFSNYELLWVAGGWTIPVTYPLVDTIPFLECKPWR